MKATRTTLFGIGTLTLALVIATALTASSGCSSNEPSSKTGSAGVQGSAGAQGGAGAAGTAGVTGAAGAGAAGVGAAGSVGTAGGGGSMGVAGAGIGGASGAAGGAGSTGTAGSTPDAGADAPTDVAANADAGAFTLTSTSFKMVDGGLVFAAAQSAPMNQSPELEWTGVPAGTLSFALSMYDATAQNTHFVLWDIDKSLRTLPANLPRGAMPTLPAGATWKSAFGGTPGYEGPGGGGVNNYQLVLWALKVAKLDVGNMSLNQIHSTLLPAQSLGSATILAKGTRNGL